MSAPGTFLPVKAEDTAGPPDACRMGRDRRGDGGGAERRRARSGGRIVAVGTTALRLLESAADEDGTIRPFPGETDIFITPGYRFRAADLLMTNFHLPRSTLFMLVVGVLRARDDAARLCACHRGGLSLLFLRRRVPVFLRHSGCRMSELESHPAGARVRALARHDAETMTDPSPST